MAAAAPGLGGVTALNTRTSADKKNPLCLNSVSILHLPLKSSASKRDTRKRRKAKLVCCGVDRRGGVMVFAEGGEMGGYL